MNLKTNISKKEHSVLALFRLLNEIISSTDNDFFDNIELNILRSQNALSKLSIPDIGIFSMSLNTQKTISNRILINGYESLDKARRSAHLILEDRFAKKGKIVRQTKRALQKQLNASLAQSSLLRQDLNHLINALKFSMSKLRDYSNYSKNPVLAERLTSDLAEIRARAAPAIVLISLISK